MVWSPKTLIHAVAFWHPPNRGDLKFRVKSELPGVQRWADAGNGWLTLLRQLWSLPRRCISPAVPVTRFGHAPAHLGLF